MNPTIIKELVALIILVISIGLFYASLAPMAYVACYIVVVVMFLVFIFSTLKRTDRDEREQNHHTMAAESGYVVGAVALLLGILVQTITVHKVDSWLFIALVAMLVTRLAIRFYLDKKQ